MAPKKSPKAFAKSESKKRKVEQEVEEEPEVDQEEGMESVTGSARKSLTANMLNQMRYATMKLEKVDSGEIKVSDAEHQELQGKVQFLRVGRVEEARVQGHWSARPSVSINQNNSQACRHGKRDSPSKRTGTQA